MHPNPNNGNITPLQMVADDKPVHAEIFDAVGRKVYAGDLTFMGGNSRLQLGDITPGLYLLRLKDTKERQFIFKFVVQ